MLPYLLVFYGLRFTSTKSLPMVATDAFGIFESCREVKEVCLNDAFIQGMYRIESVLVLDDDTRLMTCGDAQTLERAYHMASAKALYELSMYRREPKE